MSAIIVRVQGGYFMASKSQDPDYPGIDIEFVADDDRGQNLSRPRVLFEKPIDGDLRVLIWNNPNNEDYEEEVEFNMKG